MSERRPTKRKRRIHVVRVTLRFDEPCGEKEAVRRAKDIVFLCADDFHVEKVTQ